MIAGVRPATRVPAGDWYILSAEAFRHLRGVPGIQLHRHGPDYIIHRTHLPLLPGYSQLPLTLANTQDWRGITLRPYQPHGVAFARSRRGSLLAWQMRTGKTATAVCSHEPADGRLLIVAPLSTRAVWLYWLRQRWPQANIGIISGLQYDPEVLKTYDICLIHYDILRAWQTIVFDLGTLIIDEAHNLSNQKAYRTRAVTMLASTAKRVIALTGTPIWNRPVGLFPILSVLNPGAWGVWYSFATRYCDGRPGEWGFKAEGSSHEDEFQARLGETMDKLLWDDVASEMPAVIRTVETVKVDAGTAVKLTKLAAKACKATAHTAIGDMAALRRVLGAIKLPAAVEAARKPLVNGRRVVVWSWHRDLAGELHAQLGGYCITGDTAVADRNRILTAWRAGEAKALVITLGVGQVGIDLSAARHAVFAEQDFTPAVMSQSEFRTFDPSRPMELTYIVADHPVDARIVRSLVTKVKTAQKTGVPAAETAIDLLEGALARPDEIDVDADLMALLEQ